MTALRVFLVVLCMAGGVLVGSALLAPICANYAGTERDSGYPCRVERSNGTTEFVLSRSTTVSVPAAPWLGLGLVVGGSVMLGRSLRSRNGSDR